MTAPTYDIRTLADFLTVPPDRLEACLAEFAVCVEVARLSAKMFAPIAVPLSRFVWTDDNAPGLTDITLTCADGEISLREMSENVPPPPLWGRHEPKPREREPRMADNAPRRLAFRRAVEKLERTVREQPEYSDPAIGVAHLDAARERLVGLYDEAIGFRARPHKYHRHGQFAAAPTPGDTRNDNQDD